MSQVAQERTDKFAQRRAQLAVCALRTLAELGYARTSLREIAQNSTFSHGVLHYYFRDKVDLITFCVRQYKAESVTRYDRVVATAATADELRAAFVAAVVDTLRKDAPMHRLWYDLRNQSLFEESFRDDVRAIEDSLSRMVDRIAAQYAELRGLQLAAPRGLGYPMIDGVFQQALARHLAGDDRAADDLADRLTFVLDGLLA